MHTSGVLWLPSVDVNMCVAASECAVARVTDSLLVSVECDAAADVALIERLLVAVYAATERAEPRVSTVVVVGGARVTGVDPLVHADVDVLFACPNTLVSVTSVNNERTHSARPPLHLEILPDLAPLSPSNDNPPPGNCSRSIGSATDVCLGGTFDHLHNGHKILLTVSALLASCRVVCGVSADELLVRKKHRELIEPLSARCAAVEALLRQVRGQTIALEIVPIHDVYGPTVHDDALTMLVVSEETRAGHAAINTERARRALAPLDCHIVSLLCDNSDSTHDKISSSAIRERMARELEP